LIQLILNVPGNNIKFCTPIDFKRIRLIKSM